VDSSRSRDRQGASCRSPSIKLLGRRDMLRLPKPSCASMACPSSTARLLATHPIEMAAGVSLKIVHDSLRCRLRLHHGMHMITSYVGRQQIPAAIRTHALNRLQDDITAGRAQEIWRLIHAFFLEGGTCQMLFHNRGPTHIVPTVDGAGCIAVQATAIASKGDQVGHGNVRSILTLGGTVAARNVAARNVAELTQAREGRKTR
jgi:hypothetical protein